MKYWLLTLATIQRQSLFWNYENVVTDEDPADFMLDCFKLDENVVLIMIQEISKEQFIKLKEKLG